MKSRWVVHQGKRIWWIDISHLYGDIQAFRSELEAASAVTVQEPEDSVLVLADARETVITSDALRTAQEISARTTRHVRKTAVIGVSGMRRALLNVVSTASGQRFTAFDDEESAKNWLVQDG